MGNTGNDLQHEENNIEDSLSEIRFINGIAFLTKKEKLMGKTESVLQHDAVDKEESFSEIHFFNEVEFYLEFDKLISKYKFLLDIDNYLEYIPTDTEQRYDTFKKSAVRYYALRYLQEYRDLTLRSKIKSVVTGLHQECFQMVNNPKLKEGHAEYDAIYLKATRFINEFVAKGKSDLAKKYSKEDLETMVYLLHRENYFKVFPIPDATFDVNSPSNSYAIIAEVYARYFLFAEFIERVYNSISQVKEGNDSNAEPMLQIKNNATKKIIKETRTVSNLINKSYLEKYKILIKTLSESNPLASIANKPAFKSQRLKLLAHTSDLYIFQKKMVYKDEENKVIIDDEYKKLDTFLMYLFSYLINEGWMNFAGKKLAGNRAATVRVINNTLYCKSDENKSIDIDGPTFNSFINSMINGEIAEDNFYVKFIKMLIA